MPVTPDSEEFLQGIRDYIGPYIGQFNYNEMTVAFSDKSRFYTQGAVIDEYHEIRNSVILSSGCGFGGTLMAYADLGAGLAIGAEVDPDYVRLAGLRIRSQPCAGMVRYDGDSLPFADASFDIVDSVQVLEHVDDPKIYLDEIRRVMKPGAVCYIEFPNRPFPFEQHTDVPLVNWLPKRMGDALATWLATLPFFTPQQSARLESVRTISRRYISLLTLYRLLKGKAAAIYYLEPPRPLLKRLCEIPGLKFIIPNKTTRVIFKKKAD